MGLRVCVTSLLQNPLLNLLYKNDPLGDISTFDDLYIFRPEDATGVDLVIADYVGSAVNMQQTTPARRPTLNGRIFELGILNNDSRGVVTDQSITFKEVFIACSYDNATFTGFATILSGTGANGAKRIMGNTGTDDLITSTSVNDSGLIRINNGAETAVDVLPLSFSVVHSATDFTTPLDISDTITVGYNSQDLNRAWLGSLGAMIFSRIALDNTQRQEILDAMLSYHA